MELHIVEIVLGLIGLVNGGGWVITWQLKRRLEKSMVQLNEIKVNEENFEYYKKRIDYLEKRLFDTEKIVDELKEIIKKLQDKS